MPPRDPHRLGPLFEQSRAGDAGAWNTLLGKLRPYLQALVRSWLGADLARRLGDSDIVQEALTRISSSLSGFRGQSVPELLGWAKRIAYNATLDRKRAPRCAEAPSDLLQQLPGQEPPPLQVLAGEEEALRLAHALEQLSPPRREVVRGRLLDGLSFAQISERLGRPAGALRVLFLRAIRELRTLLDDHS